ALSILSTLVDDLLYERRYAELLALIEPHLPLVDKAARRRLPLQRLHDWFVGWGSVGAHESSIARLVDEHQHERTRLPPGVAAVVGRLNFVVPRQSDAEKYAKNIFRAVYLTDEVRRFIAKQRPYAAIPLLRLDHFEKHEFSA